MNLQQSFKDNDSLLETICSSIVDGVLIADADKNFLYWNETAKEMFPNLPTDVDPKEWPEHFQIYYEGSDQVVSYDDLPLVKALNGKTFSDYRLVTKDKHHPDGIVCSVNGKPIMENGKIAGAFITFSDVTAQVHLENQIKKERQFYMEVLDLLPSLVCIKGLDGKYIYANKSFLKQANVDSIIGKTLYDLLESESVKKIKSHEKMVLELKCPIDFEEDIVLPNGKKLIFHATRFPYLDTKGNIAGVCGILKDVTKELQAKMEIEQERNKTAHISKLAAIGILAAEIAHEIKNPLTIIRTNNDVIKYALNEKEIDRDLVNRKMISQNETIDRMDRVASSLGLLSKDASKECPVDFRLCDLFEDIKSLISFRTRKLGIEIEVKARNCLDTVLNANRVQLSEVLLNLIVNALDAIEEQKNPKVSIECERKSENILMKVYDNGPGVDEKIADKIFEPFFTTKDISKGTGLGLSISKKIINQHHGDLYYEKSGKVHCFVVQLPVS